jgi:transcriptional regulator of acetoin/glycerol metabolism
MSTPRPATPSHLLIEQSWQRCREWGLGHQTVPRFEILEAHALQDWLARHTALLQISQTLAQASLDSGRGRSHCLIRLGDPQARVLATWGQLPVLDQGRAQGMVPGACWSERNAGTNAMGTALACAQALHIDHDQHYLKANRFISGSAAPVLDAERQVVGVLDVSSDSYLPPAHTLGLVRMLSQSIENRLILDCHGADCWKLVFNAGKDNLDSQWAGLLMFDEQGRVMAANRRADSLLGLDPVGVAMDTLFKTSLGALLEQPPQRPFALQALARNRFQCLLQPPLHSRAGSSAVPASAQPPRPATTALEQQLAQATRLLEKNIPLLIQGETGVGKEYFVKALHRASSRASGPLVAVNCAAIPAELVESELFGYERGAFTGAHSKGNPGLIRKADKGVLFLDEIGDMPPATQARLLRVLQERCIQPLGSGDAIEVDIRVVCASHQNLQALMATGRFREDLYYRINGLRLVLPPLRERHDKREVIEQIWRECREPQQSAVIPEAVMTVLMAHAWPGNLRQLHNVMQVGAAMAQAATLSLEDLPADFIEQASVSLPVALAVETADLDALLEAYSGNISQVARQLGLSRNTVYKRLRERSNP